jgi:drug/metabolite transporter (DMT)-like permease
LPLHFSVVDLLALGAAACWALTGVLSAPNAKHLGAFAFTRWRMLLVLLMLWPVVLVSGSWRTLQLSDCAVMAFSGLVGIFIGDTALFASMNRLGPRRTGVLFATNAFFSALIGFWVFDERMGLQALLGAILVIAGVMTAILLGRHKDESHSFETTHGSMVAGIGLGLVAALCQALGAMIAKPVMAGGIDPIAATAVRVSATCTAQFVLLWSGFAAAKEQQPINRRILSRVALIGFIGMGVGMTLILLALKHGDVGTVGILSSVSPVLVLPLLWLRLGRAPARGAWIGAGLTVLGTMLVVLR